MSRNTLPRSAVLVVNTKSRRGQELFDEACRKFEEAGIELLARHAVRDPAKLSGKVKEAVDRGAPMVIVGGGDGSLSSSVDHLKGTDTVFALLPLGTANSFARTMGIPVDLDGAINVIRNGVRKRIDLGMINDDYYANNAAIGLAPMIAETIPHWVKGRFGRLGYLAWGAWRLFKFKPFLVTVNNEQLEATEVRIANGRFHGGTELVEEARVDSGEIIIQVVTGRTRRHLLWNWFTSALRLPQRHATVREFKGVEMRIATDPPLPISIDGEVLARTPVTARVARGAIEIAAPV